MEMPENQAEINFWTGHTFFWFFPTEKVDILSKQHDIVFWCSATKTQTILAQKSSWKLKKKKNQLKPAQNKSLLGGKHLFFFPD